MMIPEFCPVAAETFVMGALDAPHPEDGEGPERPVTLDAYQIATGAVSTARFAAFVQASGYVTTAEQREASQVFFKHLSAPDDYGIPFADAPWWRRVPGADWRFPNGRQPARAEDPVVHVSLVDALAYCHWCGVRLPTEAEWECAAKSGADATVNIWQGDFPDAPASPPGVRPVHSGRPNAKGLYHMCGNVWEWTADGFGRLHSPRAVRNPTGNLNASDQVVKGGSYLCAPSYCARFHPSSRRAEHPLATTGHLGFRVVR